MRKTAAIFALTFGMLAAPLAATTRPAKRLEGPLRAAIAWALALVSGHPGTPGTGMGRADPDARLPHGSPVIVGGSAVPQDDGNDPRDGGSTRHGSDAIAGG